MISRISLLLAFLLVVVGCGGNGGGDAAGEATGGATGDATEVTITPVGNEIKYEVTEFTVQAGETVRLIFDNLATSPAMQHNVVILQSSDAIDRVGMAALEAGAEQDYIPQDDAIIAYTPMAQPQETVEVTFEAPSEPGDYPYICTFPGHYTLMQGTMRVVE